MTRLLHFYRLLNILSIDIVAGSLCSALFFAHVFNVVILPYGLISLGFTVWIVYTADHLRDAFLIKKRASSRRHLFHQQYFKPLVLLLILAIVFDGVMTLFIRPQVLYWGWVLIAMVAFYLIIQRYIYFMKEFFVACLYTIGVLLPSLAVTSVDVSIFHFCIIIQFGFVALLNLLVFSWFDYENDLTDNQRSFVTQFGKRFTKVVIWSLTSVIIVTSCILIYNQQVLIIALIPLLMNGVLITLLLKREFFIRYDYYRLLGDAVFLIPSLLLI